MEQVSKNKIKSASAASVLALTGFEAGGVGPCGFPAPLHAVFVEERVFAQSDVWCGAGVKPAMFRCTPAELRGHWHQAWARHSLSRADAEREIASRR